MRCFLQITCTTMILTGCVSSLSSNAGNSGVSGNDGVSGNTVISGDTGNTEKTINAIKTGNTFNTRNTSDSVNTRKTGVSVDSGVSVNTGVGVNSIKTRNSGDSGVDRVAFQGFVGEPLRTLPQDFGRAPLASRLPARGAGKLLAFAGGSEFGPIVLPVRYAPVVGVISSDFGPRIGGVHKGIDFKAAKGSPVFAYGAGVVISARYSVSFGNVVEISHGGGWSTLYAHLSKITLVTGEVVKQGSLLGLVGQTGHATGSHVHFEVRFRGQAVNPFEKRPTVLLAAR